VVLAVPAKAVAPVLDEIAELVVGDIIVDPTNPADEDREVILRAAASLAEAVVLLAPGARVVKAFNTILASRFNDPVVDGVPLDGFYAGDDADAKRVVAGLLAEMGFHPTDGDGSWEFYFMCDEIESTVKEIEGRGGVCGPRADRGWGVVCEIEGPGGRKLALYEPRHPTAHGG